MTAPMLDDLDNDLAEVFFSPDDFGAPCVRRRTGAADLPFSAIIGEQSAALFEDRLRGSRRRLLCAASVDLHDGDRVQVLAGPLAGHYRAGDIVRRNDGRELSASLALAAGGQTP